MADADVSPAIEIEIITLDRPVERDDLALLSDEERSRANAFLLDRHRNRFVIAHAALRRCLGSRLDLPPDRIRYRHGPFGKPALADPHARLQFNLSHSGDIALIAIGAGLPVGIDIERIRPERDILGLAAACLTKRERRRFESLPAIDRTLDFYRRWTCKEAVLKAIGCGLAGDLLAVEIDLGQNDGVGQKDPGGIRLWSASILGHAAAFAALASTHSPPVINCPPLAGKLRKCEPVALSLDFARLHESCKISQSAGGKN